MPDLPPGRMHLGEIHRFGSAGRGLGGIGVVEGRGSWGWWGLRAWQRENSQRESEGRRGSKGKGESRERVKR